MQAHLSLAPAAEEDGAWFSDDVKGRSRAPETEADVRAVAANIARYGKLGLQAVSKRVGTFVAWYVAVDVTEHEGSQHHACIPRHTPRLTHRIPHPAPRMPRALLRPPVAPTTNSGPIVPQVHITELDVKCPSPCPASRLAQQAGVPAS